MFSSGIYVLQMQFYSPIYYKAIHWGVYVPENRVGNGAGVNGIKFGLPGIEQVFKIYEN